MKILLIDNSSSFLDFSLRCMDKGYEVRVWCGTDKRGNRSKVGDGMINKVADWRSSMNWADLIVTSDNVKYLREIEGYRKRGYPIFNGHADVTEWELDRGQGMRIFEKAKIPLIPSDEFSNYDKAMAHVANNKKRYVSKPSGDADKALSYVSKSPKDMMFMLERWKRLNKIRSPFILQEFIPGIEMAVSGYFGPNGFCSYFLENFEFKKLMNDDYGCNTGEQGTVMKYTKNSKLADMVLKPLEGELYRQGYVGFIDVSVIIDEQGNPWPLEHTCGRFGWPLFQIQQELHPEPVKWMLDLVDGEDTFEPDTSIAAGVVLAIGDYPYGHLTKKEVMGYPIYGITKQNNDHVHLCEVMMGNALDDNMKPKAIPVTAGDYVLVATGKAKNVSKACENAYEIIEQIEIPSSPIVRTDIGKRLEKQIPKLQKHGFAMDWSY